MTTGSVKCINLKYLGQPFFNGNYEDKSRKTRCARLVACMGERRGAYRGLVGRPEGKRTTWPRRGWLASHSLMETMRTTQIIQ